MEEDSSAVPAPRRSTRRRRAALALAILLVAALGLLWIERRPIATRFVDQRLAAAGVPARYAITDLGLGRQRLTDVVIGDPAHPDLVADWIETRTGIGLSGPALYGVRAGHVRLRGRIVNGRVSLGAIDRLLPAPSGKPFALPALDVDVADARVRLETPAGLIGLKIAGAGKLDDGFRGRVAAVAPALTVAGCRVEDASAVWRVTIDAGRPLVRGPIRVARARCGAVRAAAAQADLHLELAAALDHWQGSARLTTGPAGAPPVRLGSLDGRVAFTGTAALTQGRVGLTAASVRTDQATARHATIAGDYAIGRRVAFAGRVGLHGAAVDPALLARATGWRGAGQGTPAGPLAAALAAAVTRAGRSFGVEADLAATGSSARISRLSLASASGLRAALRGALDIGRAGVSVTGDLATSSGGGLPQARVSLAQSRPGAPVRGVARIGPYAAGGASLSLTPVTFGAAPGGVTRIVTHATLSGPLGDGRVEALTLPITAAWNGQLLVNPGCAPLAWRSIAVSGLTLAPARLTLCPIGPALVSVEGGALSGGARLAATELTGRLGGTPLRLATGGATLRLAERGFTLDRVAARLGAPGRETLIEAATLAGRVEGGAVAGSFAGGGGRIGNVPLLLSAADGVWRLAGGVLDLTGALTVADAQTAAPRFRPMQARGVALQLKDGRIAAGGMLHEPTTGTPLATVRLDHTLSSGTGTADLAVPDLSFREGFQPELLTPLTFGVVADVRGSVAGQGRIAWAPAGVTSTGRFSTGALDLAAAFGPVTGIAGAIVFDDLLGLHTPPGQVATVKTVNPGIPVENGTVRYQLLGGVQVQVEGARWPFAGGALTLEPTLLDFGAERERRMTFRVDGAAADQFLQQFDFDNLNATGVFDGVLPMVFDQSGGRIENGRLAVRPGGGTIAYVGALSQEQLGFWGNLAFQALKSLRYRSLALTLNGPLTGEMVTDVRFAGVSQGQGAKSNFLVRRLQRLPFVFNIRIKAPFRGLLDSARSFYDPRRLIQRNLPALLDEQNKRPPVQPPESEKLR